VTAAVELIEVCVALPVPGRYHYRVPPHLAGRASVGSRVLVRFGKQKITGVVVRADTPAISGPGVTLEIYLHGADDRDYRARFTLIRTDGRWWIDDVHWTQEPDARDISRT